MAEAFVKTFKREHARSVMKKLPEWFEDYEEIAPHKDSPR